MKTSFALTNYRKMLGINTISIVVDTSVPLISSIIIANLVAPDALASMSLINPIYYFVLFITIFVERAVVQSVLISLGNFDKDKAGSQLVSGFIKAAIAGAFIFIVMAFGQELYLNTYNVSDVTKEYARQYLSIMKFYYMLLPMSHTLSEYISNSSNFKLIITNRVISCVCQFVIAPLLCMSQGIAGIGLANLMGCILGILLMITHFRTPYNMVKPRWMDIEIDIINDVRRYIGAATPTLIAVIASLLINNIIIGYYGEEADLYLSIFNVVGSVAIVYNIFVSINDTVRAQQDIYAVEGNYIMTNKLINFSLKDEAIASGIIVAVLFIIAPLLPGVFNITDPSSVALCVKALRITAFAQPFMAAYFSANSYHQGFIHYGMSMFTVVWTDFICYCGVTYLSLHLIGNNGLWYGIVLYNMMGCLGIVAATWLICKKDKNKSFPWLTDKTKKQPLVYEIVTNEKTLIDMRDEIGSKLSAEGLSSKMVLRVQMIIEEFGMLVVNNNKNDKKEVLSEWDLFRDDEGVTVVVRDNGKELDFSNEDNSVGSFGAYFLSCLVPNEGEVKYASTVSMNRHRYRVEND